MQRKALLDLCVRGDENVRGGYEEELEEPEDVLSRHPRAVSWAMRGTSASSQVDKEEKERVYAQMREWSDQFKELRDATCEFGGVTSALRGGAELFRSVPDPANPFHIPYTGQMRYR